MKFNRIKLAPYLARNKKILIGLPLLSIPFLCLMFWAMVDKEPPLAATAAQERSTLLQLPSSDLSADKQMSKLEHYRKLETDSTAKDSDWQNILEKWNKRLADSTTGSSLESMELGSAPANYEEQLYRKLTELEEGLHALDEPDPLRPLQSAQYQLEDDVFQQRAERLTQMATMKQVETGEDYEIEQLNRMLDKIIRIQEPKDIADSLAEQKHTAYALDQASARHPVGLLQQKDSADGPKFLSQSYLGNSEANHAAMAVIHEAQTITTGSTVKMRLLDDLRLPGIHLSKGNLIYGEAQINGERILIRVRSISSNQRISSVRLSAYDLDGIAGIYLPDLPAREVLVSSADQTVQSIGLGQSISSSLAIEAANAGIQAAKSLFSRKAKVVRVQLQPDYRIQLKDESNNL